MDYTKLILLWNEHNDVESKLAKIVKKKFIFKSVVL